MGVPATAEGRPYVPAPAGATTPLQLVQGAKGDEVDWLWIAAGAGSVALKDGGVTVWTWDALTTDRFVPLNLRSMVGGWSLTTVGVAALAAGCFS
jgi:hypothetical protein